MDPRLRQFSRVAAVASLCVALVAPWGADAQEEEDPEEAEADAEEEEPPPDREVDDGVLPGLESEAGSLRVGVVIQTGFDLRPNQVEGKRNTFTLERARLRLGGHLGTEKLTYLLVGDAAAGVGLETRPGAPGSEVLPDDGEVEVPFLLDARLRFQIPKIGVSFAIGRFVPKWGLTMPERVTELGAVAYPLYVHGGVGSLGTFRSLGAEVELAVWKHLRAGGGIFNGGRNTWLDDNDRKDMVAFITVLPVAGLEIRASGLFAFPEVVGGVRDDGSEIERGQETRILPVLEARYRDYGFDVMAGAAGAIVTRHEDDTRENTNAVGVLGHLGYVIIGDWFQLMGRFEWWEPDEGESGDTQMRVTAGPQLRIEGIHAQLNINYIQDFFEGARGMCVSYLDLDSCLEGELPAEAQESAATILVEFALDL
jgi:hypothetical protein